MSKSRFSENSLGFFESSKIITDTQTGVQYLFWVDPGNEYASGLTLLVDKNGKPLIDPEHVFSSLPD